MQNKLDIDGVRFSLDNIVSTLQLVMEDMEQEHLSSKGVLEGNFFNRMGSVYLPVLNLIQCSAFDWLREVEEATV